MTSKKQLLRIAFTIILAFLSFQNSFSQCFQIESILVDACGGQEGLNEMVRFKVGDTALNTGTLTVTWPNNPWQGLIQNSTTMAKTAALNADILDAGGCGQLIEPAGGILPANASVILVTSYNLDTALNSFGALTEDIYILYQNNAATTSGHFANSGSGLRTLTMFFSACSDTVTYDRSLLINPGGATVPADGATVLFSPSGTPTYTNNGCSAPVQPFTVDAGMPSISACAGSTISLNGTAQGQQSINWSAPTGVFSNPGNLTTTYAIDPAATGSILITLTATNSCGLEISDTINVNITSSIAPDFATPVTICTGSAAPALSATSPNGITGTWAPTVVSNTASGNYVFTPDPGQCAAGFTLHVEVSSSIAPDFATPVTICTGSAAPVLNAASPNGITGTWAPTVVSNTASGNYVFTPDPGQCAAGFTLHVEVSSSIAPDFATPVTICTGSAAPVLNAASPNGITGTWAPTVVSNTTSGNYVFTPDPGQCAAGFTLHVEVSSSIAPDFATPVTICTGSAAPVLNATSPNGITGTWAPAVVSNTASGNYVFTPDPGQCASEITMSVTVSAIDFGIDEGCVNSEYMLKAVPVDGSFNPDQADYLWKNDQGNAVGTDDSLNVSELLAANPVAVQFPVTYELTVSDGQSCPVTKNIKVYGTFCNIPKGISPNNDNKNDQFDLTGLGVKDITIFNRYGTEVYHCKNYTNQWKGLSDKGKELPDATYFYVIVKDNDETVTGWVYINR